MVAVALAKNSIWNLIGQVLPMLIGVFTIPYIVHGLGSTGYGLLSIAFTVLGYFGLFDLGLSRATVKFVAENSAPERMDKIPELVWTSLFLLVCTGSIGGLLASTLVGYAVQHVFNIPAEYVRTARISLYLLCASMPVMLANDALRGVVEAGQRFDLVNYVKAPSSIAFYVLAAITASAGMSVPAIVALLILVRLASAGAYFGMCFYVFPVLRSGFRISRAALKPLSVFGGWIMVSNFTQPAFASLERFIIVSQMSVGMLAYYSAPFDLVSKALIFPSSIAPTLFPYFSYHGTTGIKAVSEATSRSIKYLLVVMTPIAVIFIIFAKDILQIWLGTEYAVNSAPVLQLLAISFFMNAFAYIPYSSVQALGRPDLKALLDVVGLPLYAVSTWWLTKVMGIRGAALSKVAITVFDVSFLFFFASRLGAFSLADCLTGPLLRGALVSISFAAGVSLIGLAHASLAVSAALAAICCAGYAVAFWMLAMDEDERMNVIVLIRRFTTTHSTVAGNAPVDVR